MRLGELKNIIDQAVSDQNTIIFSSENLYEGKRFRVKGYADLIDAVEHLVNQPWVKADKKIVQELMSRHGKLHEEIEVSPDEHNRLNALVNDINKSLPVFYGILETVTPEQDEQVVNVKIPEDYTVDLEKLSSFNKELQDVFKLVVLHKGLRGDEVRFQGFDIGTSWYQMLIVGAPIAYYGFMGIIEIAEKLIHARKAWYESEEMRLSYEVKKQEMDDKKAKAFTMEEHIKPMLELKAQQSIDALIEKMGDEAPNSATEMSSHLLKGLQKIIALMEKGTEFHPSLNTPEFIDTEGNAASFHVDYDRLKKHLEASKQKEEPKQLENQSSATTEEDGDE